MKTGTGGRLIGAIASAVLLVCVGIAGKAGAVEAIALDGVEIPRLAPAPYHIADQAAVDAFFSAFVDGAITDFRTVQAAEDAVGLGPINEDGEPVRLGKIAYVRPGLGNILFSPAFVYLLAQHFDRVVVMYTNMTEPAPGATALRPVEALEGVPIPAAIAGQVEIYAIGSPELNLISFLQQSDVFLEQLEIIRRAWHRKARHLLGDSWVFAHSQGVNDAVLTDHRLRTAEFVGFRRVVGIAGAVMGGRLLESAIGQSFVDGAFAIAGEQGAAAMEALKESVATAELIEHLAIPGPDFAKRLNLEIHLVTRTFAAFGGTVDPALPQGNIRGTFLFLAGFPDGNGEVKPNDGVEDFTSTLLGSVNRVFPQTDHILITEDPEILAEMLETLDAADD